MRIVLDTNVLISGIFFGGIPGKIVTAWRDAAVRIVTSPTILSEYADVFDRLAEKYPKIDPHPVLTLLMANCECVESPPLSGPVCDDPDDDKFFACGDLFAPVTPVLEPLFINLPQLDAETLERTGGFFEWVLRLVQQRKSSPEEVRRVKNKGSRFGSDLFPNGASAARHRMAANTILGLKKLF